MPRVRKGVCEVALSWHIESLSIQMRHKKEKKRYDKVGVNKREELPEGKGVFIAPME